ncbi:hypothetical protein [Epilithonimonas hispanica]|uniref:Uncharacterized protein n=1 Tax=Epilithonimonas hispanica TaxID=358687 RepID=A0A3D9CLM5_9FLAO|nr:hypothetical protein [Epilithonimonas hispanica]REC66651.1 hypothetical protein DRF58_16170 [Epilithonimonas hispanica]REC66659.1 hypothetical protein DRF58_16210 [Epilithonimonas hispanica]
MTTFNVSIPDNKTSLFLEFLELIGAQYKNEKEEIFELSEKQKKILDSQENLPLSEYQDNDEFIEELKKEYGL